MTNYLLVLWLIAPGLNSACRLAPEVPFPDERSCMTSTLGLQVPSDWQAFRNCHPVREVRP